ncbi:MAG: class I SAM-dependent methyltransferase [Gordonia polyisoprenivorans]|nr:class I SAM-dependent methyltransferase [Gordonia polyisoprenivorans]
MPAMSAIESAFCRSASWNRVAGGLVPWSLQGATLSGSVLEIGCGSGAMAEQILRRHPGVRYVAIDVDSAMVARARQRLNGVDDRVQVAVADALALPYPESSFDTVVSFLMLHHTVEWEQVVAECIRVLRPGGRLVGYDLVSTKLARTVHHLDRSPFRLITVAELAATLRAIPVTALSTTSGVAGHVMRFSATR